MADESKTIIEGGAKDGAETAPAKKGPNKMILFGGIGLGAIVVGLVLALFVIKPMLSDSPAESTEEPKAEEHAKADEHAKAEEPKKKEESHEKKSSGHGKESSGTILHSVENIVVNPAGTGGSRYLSVSFAFELGSKEEEGMFVDRDAIIRDALITILSSKSVAQLTDPREKEITRLQIKRRIETLLKTEEIAGVYYTDFVLQ